MEEIEFTAGVSGVYQIEVEGFTSADYRLEIIPVGGARMPVRAILRPTRGRWDPFIAPTNTPTDDVGLPSAPVGEYHTYLPVVLR